MAMLAEVETLVVAAMLDAAEATRGNGATTAGEWDTYPACVGNRAEELKVKAHREAAVEEVAAGPTHLFQAWMG